MYEGNIVLCAANSYEKKYYFNEDFDSLPQAVKDELKIMCVLFTEDIGGILEVEFDEEGTLCLTVRSEEGDLLFDEIGCELKIKQLRIEKADLFESLENFYKVFLTY
jgi:hypothetical protein